jgi:tetratricopeptide (TPR) repeat protein
MEKIKGKGLLRLETKLKRLLFEGKVVARVTPKMFYVFGLLIHSELERQTQSKSECLAYASVTLEDLIRISNWRNSSKKVMQTTLSRYHRESLKLSLLTHPKGEKTKSLRLNSELVTRVSADVSLEELRHWLGIMDTPIKHSDTEAILVLTLAQAMFEDGRYPDAIENCQKALQVAASANQKLLAMALLAWMKTFSESVESSWQAIQELHNFLALSRKQELIASNVEARVWLQEARHHWKHLEWGKASKALDTAEKFLQVQDSIEWAGIHAGRGFIAQHHKQWSEAKGHYHQAFQFAGRSQWRWSMTAQATNLGAVLLEEANYLSREERTQALEEARTWFKKARDLADEDDFGGAVDLEANLALVNAKLGCPAESQEWFEKAEKVLKASGNEKERAIFLYDMVEIRIIEKNWSGAKVQTLEALALFEKLGMKQYQKLARKRLDEIIYSWRRAASGSL